jgi:tetratricopeptide (TPR) repeat protein
VLCLLNRGQETEALNHLELLLSGNNTNSSFLATKGFILFQQEDIDSALKYLRLAIKQDPKNKEALINLAMSLSTTNAYAEADRYLRQARKIDPKNLIIHLGLLQNAIVMQDSGRINQYLYNISKLFRMREITYFFSEHAKGYHLIYDTLAPIHDQIILPYLAVFIKEQALKLDDIMVK